MNQAVPSKYFYDPNANDTLYLINERSTIDSAFLSYESSGGISEKQQKSQLQWIRKNRNILSLLVDTELERVRGDFNQINWSIIASELSNSSKLFTFTPMSCYQYFRNSSNLVWTQEQLLKLQQIARKYQNSNWNAIANEMDGFSPFECLQQYQQHLNPDLIETINFTKDEDQRLQELSWKFGSKNIDIISMQLENRSPLQVYHRLRKNENFSRVLVEEWKEEDERRLFLSMLAFPELNSKGKLLEEDCDDKSEKEEALYKQLHNKNIKAPMSFHSWERISSYVPGKAYSECRDKWIYNLDPKLNTSKFTNEEDIKLLQLIETIGPDKWTEISRYFDNRKDFQIYSRWMRLMNDKVRAGDLDINPKILECFYRHKNKLKKGNSLIKSIATPRMKRKTQELVNVLTAYVDSDSDSD